MGVPKKAVGRLAQAALAGGIRRKDTTGSLRRYLDYVYHYNETADNIRVYAEKVWIFAGDTLITVLDLPSKYKGRANELGRKKE